MMGMVINWVLNLAFALSVMGFLIMHISLVAANTTTIEAYEKKTSPKWHYDLGRKKNFEQNNRWANLPPELLFDVIRRLEESESTWLTRKHVVAFAVVCRSWRSMCKEIVKSPEFCGKLTFPISLNHVSSCSLSCLFHARDKSNLTYHLFLYLSPGEQIQILACLSAYKQDTKSITPFKVTTVVNKNGIGKSSKKQNGNIGEETIPASEKEVTSSGDQDNEYDGIIMTTYNVLLFLCRFMSSHLCFPWNRRP